MADRTEVNSGQGWLTRRKLLVGGAVGATFGAAGAYVLRRKIVNRLADWTQKSSFSATPPLVPHDPARDRASLYVARGGTPGANVDSVIAKLGGIQTVVGADDVVIIKVSAQWWNQGMTNAAAVVRAIEQVLERPGGFSGEIVVFENTHFRMPDGSGLSRAWTHPSERNVDVPGWDKLGDLIPYFAAQGAPVSFVGLVDAGASALSDDHWHDPNHLHGRYGGDGRGPIEPGSDRDGYHWDFANAFSLERSWFDTARTPLTWPRFTSPRSGLVIDLKDGVLERRDGALHPTGRKLTWINMTTANEHEATGFTAATKSTMGIVDMSAGELGTHPKARGYRSVHYFGRGAPSAKWRMAGPLAQLATRVRAPDLILTVAHWVAFFPEGPLAGDIRHEQRATVEKRTVVAGVDPVAIDAWCCRHLMHDVPSRRRDEMTNVDRADSQVSKFLRYYRQVRGSGTIDASLIEVA